MEIKFLIIKIFQLDYSWKSENWKTLLLSNNQSSFNYSIINRWRLNFPLFDLFPHAFCTVPKKVLLIPTNYRGPLAWYFHFRSILSSKQSSSQPETCENSSTLSSTRWKLSSLQTRVPRFRIFARINFHRSPKPNRFEDDLNINGMSVFSPNWDYQAAKTCEMKISRRKFSPSPRKWLFL